MKEADGAFSNPITARNVGRERKRVD